MHTQFKELQLFLEKSIFFCDFTVVLGFTFLFLLKKPHHSQTKEFSSVYFSVRTHKLFIF